MDRLGSVNWRLEADMTRKILSNDSRLEVLTNVQLTESEGEIVKENFEQLEART